MPFGNVPRRNRLRVPLTAVIATAALLLGACTAPGPVATSTQIAAPEVIGQVPAELMDFYAQPVVWSACSGGFQCAKVKVPLDYAKPGKDTVSLSVIRLRASGKRQGALLTNPGGPGGSGVTMVRDGAKFTFSDKMRGAYDIVGFDPRGVGASDGVKCLDDAQMDAARQLNLDFSSASGVEAAAAEAKRQATLCKENSGPVLAHMDTVSAARDMDVLRAVAGDKQLNYMGFSYGTKLGATYAELFPAKVGRFSLDGAMDPTLDIDEVSRGQAVGFEKALRAWAANCLSGSECPVSGTVDQAMEQIRRLHQVYASVPQQTSEGRVVTGEEFMGAVAFGMYSTDLWEPLKGALKQAFEGDASGMLLLADFSADRDTDGVYASNSGAAFAAVNCLDYQMNWDRAHMKAEAAALNDAAPTFGDLLSYSGLTCESWPFPPTGKTGPVKAAGAGPILVVGTTGDPATPYEWSEALAEQLESGVLLTWQGEGHTAYGRANECLTTAVDGYFVDGKVPGNGTTC